MKSLFSHLLACVLYLCLSIPHIAEAQDPDWECYNHCMNSGEPVLINGEVNRCPYCASGRACPMFTALPDGSKHPLGNLDENELCCYGECGGDFTVLCKQFGTEDPFTLVPEIECPIGCGVLPGDSPNLCNEGECPPETQCVSDDGACECGKCGDKKIQEALGEQCDNGMHCPEGTPCLNDRDCLKEEDGGECKKRSIGGCTENCISACTADIDCDDGSVCTTDFCSAGGECFYETISCDDGNECTKDHCDALEGCYNTEIKDCCQDNADCNDGDECTNDICNNNQCENPDSGLCCTDDNECQGGLCGYCDTPCTRIVCSCSADGSCEQESVRDDSCTGGECNPWPAPCGNMGLDCGLPEDSCQWCVLDGWGPRGEGYWKCDPYPNAEILFPQCREGDDGASPPPPPPPSSNSSDTSDNEIEIPFSLSAGQSSDDSSQESFGISSFYGSITQDHSSVKSLSSSSNSSSLSSSSSSFVSSAQSSDGDDTVDDGGGGADAEDTGDENDDYDDTDASENTSQSNSHNYSIENVTSSTSASSHSDSDDTHDDGQNYSNADQSSSSQYEQCDFCPACTSCRRCGIGIANICDEQECGSLGICVFEPNIIGGSCKADTEICSVCQ